MGNVSPFDPNAYEKDSKEWWQYMYFAESKKRERLQHILWHINAHIEHCVGEKPITRRALWDLIQNNKNFWQGLLNENNKLRKKNEILRTRLAQLQEKRNSNITVKPEEK